ncbi:TrbG/VirB9 family P-type conjugative transfer protein [Paraburkholderia sp. EG285A]|uniref:TrbG/VirB9 family P-type conjugative transfer protein n=1 Tax=Paraburkholderia sp. EG285A TaxID=3237009 RepID=UPI0034D190C1
MTILAALLFAAWSPAFALTVPGPCGTDPNVQCAEYDPNEVFQITTTSGKATLIQFEDGESVQTKGAGMGDGKAWEATKGANWILLKPAQIKPDTNFLIVTNKRRYVLSLKSAGRGDAVTWALRFDYPDTRSKRMAAEAKKRQAAADVLAGSAANTGPRNTRYSMRGDTDLKPTNLFDNGTFTYFEYNTGRDLPKVFAILPDGTEGLAPYHMEGDTIVVHETAAQFVIRLGKSVLGIRNDAYAPEGHYNRTGTTVPGEVRILKEKGE